MGGVNKPILYQLPYPDLNINSTRVVREMIVIRDYKHLVSRRASAELARQVPKTTKSPKDGTQSSVAARTDDVYQIK